MCMSWRHEQFFFSIHIHARHEMIHVWIKQLKRNLCSIQLFYIDEIFMNLWSNSLNFELLRETLWKSWCEVVQKWRLRLGRGSESRWWPLKCICVLKFRMRNCSEFLHPSSTNLRFKVRLRVPHCQQKPKADYYAI
jgi:hypothetical protein